MQPSIYSRTFGGVVQSGRSRAIKLFSLAMIIETQSQFLWSMLQSSLGLLRYKLNSLTFVKSISRYSAYTYTLIHFFINENRRALQLPAYYLQRSGVLRGGTPMAALSDPLDLQAALLHTLVHGFVIEVWFYVTHRALHWPPLFKVRFSGS